MTSDLKLELIQKIINTNNVNLLLEIKELLSNSVEITSAINEPSSTYEKVHIFNEEQQKRIDRALEQYKNGECISDEEAQKDIQAWLED